MFHRKGSVVEFFDASAFCVIHMDFRVRGRLVDFCGRHVDFRVAYLSC